MSALPEALLYDEWHYNMTPLQQKLFIKRLFDPDNCKSDAYLKKCRKRYVDQIITTNVKLMTQWGDAAKINRLYQAHQHQLSVTKLRKWATARQYLYDKSRQLELELDL